MKQLYQHIILVCLVVFCESVYQERPCEDARGMCQDVLRQQTCLGNYVTKLCPKQRKEVMCCVPDGNNVSAVLQTPDCIRAKGICKKKSQICQGKQLEGKCSSSDDSNTCCTTIVSLRDHINCSISDKVKQTFGLILINEGLCQNFAEDERNFYQNKRGFTCLGITPEIGYTNKEKFSNCSGFSGDPADFVYWCFRRSESNFKDSVLEVYKSLYFPVCNHLEQPAFYVCSDISVHSGSEKVKQFMQELGPARNLWREYAVSLNEKQRILYQDIGGLHPYLKGWMNRVDNRETFIDVCYPLV